MKTRLLATLGTVLALSAPLPASAIALGFAPSSQVVNVSDTATVDLVISGLGSGAAPSLGAFDVNVVFDPTILGFSGVTFGTQLDLGGLGSLQIDDDSVAGIVNLFELSYDSEAVLDDQQLDTFVLATLSFSALTAGSSLLTLTVNALGDADGNSLLDDSSAINDGAIESIGTVNEPASLPLTGIGMLGMIALAIRRRRAVPGD